MPGYSGQPVDGEDMKGGRKTKKMQKKLKVHQGPRGGKYVIKNGKKQYIS